MKISINLSDNLIKKLDDYAEKNYLNRTSVITFACSKFVNEYELFSSVRELSSAIRKVVNSNVLDDESKRVLSDFENVVKHLNL